MSVSRFFLRSATILTFSCLALSSAVAQSVTYSSDEAYLDEIEQWLDREIELGGGTYLQHDCRGASLQDLMDFSMDNAPSGDGPTPEQKEEITDAMVEFADKYEVSDEQGNIDSEVLGEKAVETYDKDGSGSLDKAEIKDFLKEFGVGNCFTRGKWADGLIDEANKEGNGNGDNLVTAEEITNTYNENVSAEG